MIRAGTILLICLVAGAPASPRFSWAQNRAAQNEAASAEKPSLARTTQARIDRILDDLQASDDAGRATREIDALFTEVVAYVPARDLPVLADAACARRLIRHLSAVAPETRKALLPFFRAHPDLARTLAFLVAEGYEDPGAVYAVFNRLREAREKEVIRLPNLAAAIAVVHDEPPTTHVVPQRPPPDAVALFNFYLRNEKRLAMNVSQLPAELLIHVVDGTSSLEEMEWAIRNLSRYRNVGVLYGTVPYDYEAYRTGTVRKAIQQGYSLPNIRKYGGICMDQAYFASEVGKAIGVPTTYLSARGAVVGHAWVGYLQVLPRRARWDFDSGRYEAYQSIRADIRDPQTGEIVSDAYVALRADAALVDRGRRHIAIACIDAARALMGYRDDGKPFAESPPAGIPAELLRPTPRDHVLEDRIEMIQLAIEHCPTDVRAWMTVHEICLTGGAALEHKRAFSEALRKVCGRDYPDFTFEVLSAMIRTVSDAEVQFEIWDKTFQQIQDRPDLAAAVRMEQAALVKAAGDIQRAGRIYQDIIQRYANDGPFVIDALEAVEQLLDDAGRANAIVTLYEQTWRRIPMPDTLASPFLRQSNWHRIGSIYAERLDGVGRYNEARNIRDRLGG